jgi:phage head maturation protease
LHSETTKIPFKAKEEEEEEEEETNIKGYFYVFTSFSIIIMLAEEQFDI